MNISFIGMPTSGKSTVGAGFARRLGMGFVDTDELIIRGAGMSLFDIISENGLEDFKRRERDAILGLRCENTVISTGGSAIYSFEAMKHLKRISRVVFLDIPFADMEKRIAKTPKRGIVIGPRQSLLGLYNERHALYRRYADVTIPTHGKAPIETIDDCESSIFYLWRESINS